MASWLEILIVASITLTPFAGIDGAAIYATRSNLPAWLSIGVILGVELALVSLTAHYGHHLDRIPRFGAWFARKREALVARITRSRFAKYGLATLLWLWLAYPLHGGGSMTVAYIARKGLGFSRSRVVLYACSALAIHIVAIVLFVEALEHYVHATFDWVGGLFS